MPSIPVCENHYQFLDVRINRIKLWSVLCPEKRSREYLQVIGSGFPTHNQRGAKEMLMVDDVDDRQFLCELIGSMWAELPEMKKKKSGQARKS